MEHAQYHLKHSFLNYFAELISSGKYQTWFKFWCLETHIIHAIFGSPSVIKLEKCKQLQEKKAILQVS